MCVYLQTGHGFRKRAEWRNFSRTFSWHCRVCSRRTSEKREFLQRYSLPFTYSEWVLVIAEVQQTQKSKKQKICAENVFFLLQKSLNTHNAFGKLTHTFVLLVFLNVHTILKFQKTYISIFLKLSMKDDFEAFTVDPNTFSASGREPSLSQTGASLFALPERNLNNKIKYYRGHATGRQYQYCTLYRIVT